MVRAGYQDRVDDRLYVVQGSEIKEWRTAPEGTETMAEMVWRSRIETGLARNFSTASGDFGGRCDDADHLPAARGGR